MDDRSPPWILDDEHVVLAENMSSSRPGKRSRGAGIASIGGSSGATSYLTPGGLWPFYDATILQEVLMGPWAGRMFIVPGNGAFIHVASGPSLVDGLHMTSRGYWRGLDTSYITSAQVNDSGGSLMSRLLAIDLNRDYSAAASMAPRCAMFWQGRLWVGDNVLNQDYDTLWWSSLNDGLSFSNTNTIRIEPGRGGRITAIHPIRSGSPRFLVFKERMIATVAPQWGSSSSLIPAAADALDTLQTSVQVVTEGAGCVATKSVQPISGATIGDIIFLSHDGFRVIARSADDSIAGASLPISSPIQTTIDRINFTHAQKACSAIWDQFYHCAVPLDGAVQNTHIISFDLIGGGWYLNTLDARDLTQARLTQTQERMWLQSNIWTTDTSPTNNGTLFSGYHVFKTYTGDVYPGGRSVPYTEVTKAFTFGTVDQRKKWSWFSLHGYNLNATAVIDVLAKIDNDSAVTVGQIILPPAGGNTVILGSTPLPWQAIPNGVHMRKLSLEDLPPGHMIQMILVQTNPSDFGQPTILQTAINARSVGNEFDNSAT